MSETEAPKDQTVSTRYQRWFLLALALIITVGFYRVVEPFVLSVFMAAILAGMTYPFYRWLVKKTRDRGRTSAVLTILALLFLIILPTIFFVGMLANQAMSVSESVGPWVQEQADNPGSLEIRVDG